MNIPLVVSPESEEIPRPSSHPSPNSLEALNDTSPLKSTELAAPQSPKLSTMLFIAQALGHVLEASIESPTATVHPPNGNV